jgi:hypothetical protein
MTIFAAIMLSFPEIMPAAINENFPPAVLL